MMRWWTQGVAAASQGPDGVQRMSRSVLSLYASLLRMACGIEFILHLSSTAARTGILTKPTRASRADFVTACNRPRKHYECQSMYVAEFDKLLWAACASELCTGKSYCCTGWLLATGHNIMHCAPGCCLYLLRSALFLSCALFMRPCRQHLIGRRGRL